MKKEEKKKSKKKKLLKIILGISAGCVALYAADKYIPGFHKNITKPVKDFTKALVSDVKETVSEKHQEREIKIGREDVDMVPRRNNNFRERQKHHHHNIKRRNY